MLYVHVSVDAKLRWRDIFPETADPSDSRNSRVITGECECRTKVVHATTGTSEDIYTS